MEEKRRRKKVGTEGQGQKVNSYGTYQDSRDIVIEDFFDSSYNIRKRTFIIKNASL